MCGIAGIISLNAPNPNRVVIEQMIDEMIHRGPDGKGVYISERVGFGHCRLAIIDPKEGHQPFIDKRSGIALTYNGEIYNYLELRKELSDRYSFRTDSDTEVLLKSFEHNGIDCLQSFRGMFSFAIHDKQKKQVYIVRDRLGIKPLFYYSGSGIFAFASELGALKPVIPDRVVDSNSVANYFRWQYVPTPQSIYENVKKLEPGHYLKIDLTNGRIEKNRYWHLDPSPESYSGDDYLEKLNETLDGIFRIYMRSDVPFGAFLSGGVDSSLVTAMMTRHNNDAIRTFSIGFEEEEFSELKYARQAATNLKTIHHEELLSPVDAAAHLEKIVVHMGEPFADSSAIPTWLVSQVTSNSVKMALSGDGGDELFGGYNSYIETFRDFESSIPELFKRAASPFSRVFNGSGGISGKLSKIMMQPLDKHLNQRDIFLSKDLKRMLIKDSDTEWPWRTALKNLQEDIDDLTRFQYLDAKTYLLDDILTKVDRTSMAHSLEVRVPLLDHKLVELAFNLPHDTRIIYQDDIIRTKNLLKKSAERFYSSEFLDRPKMGFGIPIVQWCEVELKDLIMDLYSNPNSAVYDWLEFTSVQKLMRQFYSGRKSLVAQVWALMMFALWMQKVHLKQ